MTKIRASFLLTNPAMLRSGLCFAETSQKTRVEEYEDEHEPCRYWKTRGKFNKYTVWEHDFEPSKRENPFMRVQDWIQLASIVCVHFLNSIMNLLLSINAFSF